MAIKVQTVNSQFEREPLIRPFGFKGGYMHEIWQTAVRMESSNGTYGIGLGTQNVLWSDPNVFQSLPESTGNSLMFAITGFALTRAKETSFINPIDLQEKIFDEVYEYAKSITGQNQLKKTFVLNALVPVDNAAWILYARKNKIRDFDHLLPVKFRPALSNHHDKVASIPITSYGMSLDEVRSLVEEDGYFILKFKLGSPGDQKTMLEQDKSRLEQIHRLIGHVETEFTSDGMIPYYLDLNGRYASKEALLQLLNHAEKIGALPHIKIVEEPFPEEYHVDVNDLGVRIAADESAHTVKNVEERIQMGYTAMALKPAAKTLSTTIKMALKAHKESIPCFCADLTVNPILVEWNKNIAARLDLLPGFKTGLLETNGHQNYSTWEDMRQYHPRNTASWSQPTKGIFVLNENYYECSGGIFDDSEHYASILHDSVN